MWYFLWNVFYNYFTRNMKYEMRCFKYWTFPLLLTRLWRQTIVIWTATLLYWLVCRYHRFSDVLVIFHRIINRSQMEKNRSEMKLFRIDYFGSVSFNSGLYCIWYCLFDEWSNSSTSTHSHRRHRSMFCSIFTCNWHFCCL